MSNKDISRYLTKENGSTFSNDTELLNLATNSKVKNKNSGIAFKKVDGAVFDKLPIEVETDAVLYTPQTLTSAQKTQARKNIGASSSSAVLYTPQTLSEAQKLIARNNIGTFSSNDVQGLLESLITYSSSSNYAKIIDIGDFRIVYGYTYSHSQGGPKYRDRSMIAEFGGYFDEIPVMLSTHILGGTHGGEQNAQGVVRNSMSPGYGCVVFYDGNRLECASYIALGRPFKENHIPLSYKFGTSEGTYSAILQDVKKNSTIILEMYARADSQTTIEVVKSDSSGVKDLTTTNITSNLHKYGWRDNEIKVSGDVYDYSVVRTQDNQFKITGSVSGENLNEYRKIVYRLVASSSNVSLKFSKTGDKDGYILLRYSVNTPTTD